MSKLVSIRLDDDVVEMIETVKGKNFTEKFHNLVRNSFREYERIQKNYDFLRSSSEDYRSQILFQRDLIDKLEHLANLVCSQIDIFEDFK